MSTGLAAWLLEQLDEDQRRREEQGETHTLDCMARANTEWDRQCRCGFADRVLAECDSKRRIIEAAEDASGLDAQVDGEFRLGPRDETTEPYVGDVILRALALPYADREGFREEWRP